VEGDVHKFQRKHIQPSFSFRHVKELYPLFWSKSVEVVEKITAGFPLGDQTRSGVSDISFWAPKVTLDIIGIAGLGRDFHTIINNDDELAQTYDDITSPSFKTSVIFGFSVLGMKWVLRFLPWDIEQNLRTNTDKIRVLCRQFIVDKKRMIKVDSSSEESADLLSKLMKSNDFSDEELVDQLLTFLMAGYAPDYASLHSNFLLHRPLADSACTSHETTSSTLEWTLYLLARHPDIQQQLRDEIRANVPYASSADGSFDLAGVLESMPLLNAVCNESLRFYPTVPQSMRVATRPTSVLGYPVPKGMLIVLSPFGINRSPQLWGPDAHVFNPQRWIDAETGKPNNSGGATSNYSFLTFLHGPRSCIGQGFSKAELRTLLAAFVGAFEMELEDPDYRPTRAGVVTTKPSGGLPLKLKVVGTWSKPV
jgi:cytochrome P450